MNISDHIDTLRKINLELYKVSIATQDTTQSLKEVIASFNSFKNRYHPIVWFFMSLINW
jgi:hypothetical protein